MVDETYNLLKTFIEFVKNRIDEGTKKGDIKRIEIDQNYFCWKIENFDYSVENGVLAPKASGDYFTKKQILFKHNVEEVIKQSDEYKKLLEHLKNKFEIEGLNFKLESFLRVLVHQYLQDTKINENLISIFLKELNEEPFKIGAIVKLQGLTLEPESIRISTTTDLRRVQLSDLEEEIPVYPPGFGMQQPFLSRPSAILKIEIFGHSTNEIQKCIEKAIILFRLFKVGGVRYLSYKMFSEAITSLIGGTITTSHENLPTTSYPIYSRDVMLLTKFWRELEGLIPEVFYDFGSSSSIENIHFAYQRYCDSLLSRGVFEQRLVSVIMGLEALYLNDFQELSRYLGLRISKFLSLAGWDPYKIKNVLKDAYRVRSFFIHGNRLNYKQKKKIQDKYGSENKLLQEVLEYLRISIILLIILRKQKDELIDMIDDLFIDKKKEEELYRQLNGISERLCLKDIKV